MADPENDKARAPQESAFARWFSSRGAIAGLIGSIALALGSGATGTITGRSNDTAIAVLEERLDQAKKDQERDRREQADRAERDRRDAEARGAGLASIVDQLGRTLQDTIRDGNRDLARQFSRDMNDLKTRVSVLEDWVWRRTVGKSEKNPFPPLGQHDGADEESAVGPVRPQGFVR